MFRIEGLVSMLLRRLSFRPLCKRDTLRPVGIEASIEAIEAQIRSVFAVPSHHFHVGTIDVPCGPGNYRARIKYDGDGPVLKSRFEREEFALATEERIPGMDLSDDALNAYMRRLRHMSDW
jgi:hypothetical protein